MIFLRFYMEFTSLLFLKTKEKGNELLHLGPWISISSHGRPLAEGTEQGRVYGAVFRRGVAPEVGESWGKGRGGRAAPVEGLGRGWGARNRRHRGERRPAVVCSGAAALWWAR